MQLPQTSPAALHYLQTLATSYRRKSFNLAWEISPDPGPQRDALVELAALGLFEQRGGAWALSADGAALVQELARDPLTQADQVGGGPVVGAQRTSLWETGQGT